MTEIASIIFAAGKGTRMTGHTGNKTILPLIPGRSVFEDDRPLIVEVLENLPPGPKAIVVNHRAEEVRAATMAPGIEYVFQPETNGTGGALLAAGSFLESTSAEYVVVTMGDVPLIRAATYRKLLGMLAAHAMAVLVFEPDDPARYGMIETDGERVRRIVEWKYWSDPRQFPPERRNRLKYCNAGVYAAGREILLKYMEKLEARPHEVLKVREGVETLIREYFLTDLAEMMHSDDVSVGMAVAPRQEVIGVDTPESLQRVQQLYSSIAAAAHIP